MVSVLGEILLTRLFVKEEIVHVFVSRVRTQIQKVVDLGLLRDFC